MLMPGYQILTCSSVHLLAAYAMSQHQQPSRNRDIAARHKSAVLGSNCKHHTGYVFRQGNPLQGGHVCHHGFLFLGQPGCSIGQGKAGGNYVDAYAERSNLFRKRADEGIKARFCSGVGNETR